jgi:uncharacterized membrane protein YagU involved in acid resistance
MVIAGAGLLVGILDISDAFIFYGLHGVSPLRILQGIASGLLGRAAFTQGRRSALLGVVLHFFIAFTAATVYLLASRGLPLSRHPLLYGTLYGLAVYVVMNYIVLPLSHVVPKPHFSPVLFVNGVAALIFCVGIPVAFIARRYIPQQFP